MLNTCTRINSLHAIMQQYDTYLIDVSGVIHNGVDAFPGAINAINTLLRCGKNVIFVSNDPNPSINVHKKLCHFGIQDTFYLVTSGDVLHTAIATTLFDKKIYHLGRNRGHALLQHTQVNITPHLADADAVILSCFIEQGENEIEFEQDLYDILQSQKPVYCPNPDRLALQGNSLRYPSGYFAHKLEKMGGHITYLGKPYNIIYDFISILHPHLIIEKQSTIMIGDSLETDIYGALNFGIDSVLVLTGISNLKHMENLPFQPTYIMQTLLY